MASSNQKSNQGMKYTRGKFLDDYVDEMDKIQKANAGKPQIVEHEQCIRLVITKDDKALIDVRKGMKKNKCMHSWRIERSPVQITENVVERCFFDKSANDCVVFGAVKTSPGHDYIIPLFLTENRQLPVAKMGILIAARMVKRYQYPLNVELNLCDFALITSEVQNGNLSTCNKLEIVRHVGKQDTDQTHIEAILNNLKVTKMLKITGSPKLKLNSNFKDIEIVLNVNDAKSDFFEIMNLPFLKMIVHCNFFNRKMLATFLKKWQAGAMEHLEAIHFISDNPTIQDFDALKKDIKLYRGFQNWGYRERYYLWEHYETDNGNNTSILLDCASGVDLIRTTDGKRATLKDMEGSVYFVVWEPIDQAQRLLDEILGPDDEQILDRFA